MIIKVRSRNYVSKLFERMLIMRETSLIGQTSTIGRERYYNNFECQYRDLRKVITLWVLTMSANIETSFQIMLFSQQQCPCSLLVLLICKHIKFDLKFNKRKIWAIKSKRLPHGMFKIFVYVLSFVGKCQWFSWHTKTTA